MIEILFTRNHLPFSYAIRGITWSDYSHVDAIKNQNPELLSPTRVMREKKDYRCYNCCSFQKYKWKDTGLSICEYFQSEIKDKGLDVVTAEHCDWNKFGAYGDGGGRSDKKE